MSRTRLSRLFAGATLLLLVGGVAYSYAEGGIVGLMLRGDLSAADKLDLLRDFFATMGPAAPLAYIVIVTIEVVVAPIPGTILYAPAGVIFGGFWGGTLSLVGNVIGAGMSFILGRALGRAAFESFVEHEHLENYEERLVDNGTLVIFLLRVNPLTSSDLVSYAAGLTSMSLWKLLLGTTLGMAPLCYAQAYLAEGLLEAYPRLIYPVLLAGLAYALVVVWAVKKMVGRSDTANQPS